MHWHCLLPDLSKARLLPPGSIFLPSQKSTLVFIFFKILFPGLFFAYFVTSCQLNLEHFFFPAVEHPKHNFQATIVVSCLNALSFLLQPHGSILNELQSESLLIFPDHREESFSFSLFNILVGDLL